MQVKNLAYYSFNILAHVNVHSVIWMHFVNILFFWNRACYVDQLCGQMKHVRERNNIRPTLFLLSTNFESMLSKVNAFLFHNFSQQCLLYSVPIAYHRGMNFSGLLIVCGVSPMSVIQQL